MGKGTVATKTAGAEYDDLQACFGMGPMALQSVRTGLAGWLQAGYSWLAMGWPQLAGYRLANSQKWQ